jgi:hypothetical protein
LYGGKDDNGKRIFRAPTVSMPVRTFTSIVTIDDNSAPQNGESSEYKGIKTIRELQKHRARVAEEREAPSRRRGGRQRRPPVPEDDVDDEILADYIANMAEQEAEGNSTFTLRSLLNGGDADNFDDSIFIPDNILEDVEGSSSLDEEDEDDDDEDEDDDLEDDISDDFDEEGDLFELGSSSDDDVENDNDPLLTDEALARLLAKQEELGLGTDELMLFDGFGHADVVETAPRKSKAKKAAKTQKPRLPVGYMSDPFQPRPHDPYNGFDVLDFDRPSLQKKPKGKRGQLTLNISDEELADQVNTAWANDRAKKKERKQQREEMRAAGLLGKKSNKPDLKAKYKEGLNMDEVKVEIRTFLRTENTT